MDLVGTYAPLPTPLTDDGSSISEIRLARLLQKLKSEGINGWAACTEVGEFNAIGYSERKQFSEMLLRFAQGVPVIVNVSAPSTVASLDLAQHASRHGAVAAILAPPYWGPFTEEEILLHYRTVGKYGDIEVIAVDPRHFISPETVSKIQDIGGIQLAEPTAWMNRLKGGKGKGRPEELKIGEMVVSTLALFCDVKTLKNAPESKLQQLFDFTHKYGTAKCAKAAFEAEGIDLGPMRGPALPLIGDPLKELMAIIAML
jgi:dihydrodipicolinate synthase/N-acetylneuraminate lyase